MPASAVIAPWSHSLPHAPELDVLKDVDSMRLKVNDARWPRIGRRPEMGGRATISLHQYTPALFKTSANPVPKATFGTRIHTIGCGVGNYLLTRAQLGTTRAKQSLKVSGEQLKTPQLATSATKSSSSRSRTQSAPAGVATKLPARWTTTRTVNIKRCNSAAVSTPAWYSGGPARSELPSVTPKYFPHNTRGATLKGSKLGPLTSATGFESLSGTSRGW